MGLRSKKMTALCLAVIFFVALDRFLKILARQGAQANLLGEFLKFDFKANYYIAFSLPLSGIWLNMLIALIILLLSYYLARAWRKDQQGAALGLFAIIAGASSNLADRLHYGYVIDYLDLKYFTVFNLADIMIVCWTVFLLALINGYKYKQ